MSGIVALGMQQNDASGSVKAVVIYARYKPILSARIWPSCRHDAQGRPPKMSDTDRGPLLPANQIIEKGISPRSRLLVNKAVVGIGEVVWQKPWIDNITCEYCTILAKKPKMHVLRLFACKTHVAEILLLKSALLYVGNDTTPLNIAAACRPLATGLFEQTHPLMYSPKTKLVSVSSNQVCKRGVIKTIALDLVFEGVCTELHHHGVLPALVAAR